jgi:hypothetical protein
MPSTLLLSQTARKDVIPTLTYHEVQVKDLTCHTKLVGKKTIVEKVSLLGKDFKPTQRFWDSMMSRFGIADSIFKYFSYKEVFDRISEVCKNDLIRVAVQRTASLHEYGFTPRLLAVTNPNKPILTAEQTADLLEELGDHVISYRSGLMTSEHQTRLPFTFKAGEDDFGTFLAFESPIDGYGTPSIYLALLRVRCVNGAIAYGSAFRSNINIGKNEVAVQVVQRVLESFNNEDGFSALKQRMEAAQKSWASVREVLVTAKTIRRLTEGSFLKGQDAANRNQALASLYQKSGELREIYGTVQLESLGIKRMRLLPTKCKVYDLFNLLTEMATHQLRPDASRSALGLFGEMISNEYDLENSCNKYSAFEDFVQPQFTGRKLNVGPSLS